MTNKPNLDVLKRAAERPAISRLPLPGPNAASTPPTLTPKPWPIWAWFRPSPTPYAVTPEDIDAWLEDAKQSQPSRAERLKAAEPAAEVEKRAIKA